jgi:hypothetical protein
MSKGIVQRMRKVEYSLATVIRNQPYVSTEEVMYVSNFKIYPQI